MPSYTLPKLARPARVKSKQVLMVASGDLPTGRQRDLLARSKGNGGGARQGRGCRGL